MKSTYFFTGLAVVIFLGLIVLRNSISERPAAPLSALDVFAQCLNDAGAKFYGAYWCPHCQDQKELLGDSKNMPYIECSTPNGQGQVKECADASITGYPTWVFTDGTRIEKLIELEELSRITSCKINTEQL